MQQGYGQQAPSGAPAWARIRLARGESGGQFWQIDQQYREARLSVGSAPQAGWPVFAPGVAPVQFEIYWDGQTLWVADTYRVGGVTLDGRPLGEWTQVRGRGELVFGGAAMQIETSAAAQQALQSSPDHATRVSLMPDGTAVALPGAWDESSLQGEATRVVDRGLPPLAGDHTQIAGPPSGLASLSNEQTRIGESPLGAYPTGPTGQGGDALRPRLGVGGVGAAQQPMREPARTVMADELMAAMQQAQEATRMVASPQQGGPSSVMVQPGYPGVVQPAQAQGPSMQGYGALYRCYGAPQQPQGYGAPQQPQAGGSGFLAPPTFDQAGKPGAVPAGGKGKQALPTRTWLLLALTVAVTVTWLMMEDEPVEEEEAEVTLPEAQRPDQAQAGQVPPPPQAGQVPPPPQAGQVPPPPQAGQVPPPPQAGQPPQPEVAQTTTPEQPQPEVAQAPEQPQPEVAQATTAPEQPQPEAATTPEQTGTTPEATAPVGPTPDRQAADLVIAGRFEEALPLYQALATQFPERTEYTVMVRVLQRRIAQRCVNGLGPNGQPCGGTP